MLRTIAIFFLLFCRLAALQAYPPYHATVQVDEQEETVSASNLVDLKEDLSTESLQELIPNYTPNSAVSIDIDLRGLLALTSFAENSTTLVVTIPNAGITETFTGSTREESLLLFKEFVKEGPALSQLLKAYARFSPIDPIAGNPNSLMARMAQADYLLSHLSPFAGCDCQWSSQPIPHQIQSGFDVGRAFTGKFDTTTVTLPLRYTYAPCLSWALIFDAPITYNGNGGASSIFSSLGMGVRLPLLPGWSLTPLLRVGIGGSPDLCTAGGFFSAGVTSAYDYKLGGMVFSLINYVGYFTSLNAPLTGLHFNYHLDNTIFKNGLSLTSCRGWTLCNREVNARVSFTDSYFAGDRLFINHFDEVGIFLLTTCLNPCVDYDCLSLGFAFQWGKESYRGYFFNLYYQF